MVDIDKLHRSQAVTNRLQHAPYAMTESQLADIESLAYNVYMTGTIFWNDEERIVRHITGALILAYKMAFEVDLGDMVQ